MPPRNRARRIALPEVASEAPPRHAMHASWRDPDDITPGARRAPREIHGWRRYDPLRKMTAHPNSGVTEAHILAADKLRELVDIATLGYSAERPLIFVTQTISGPRFGMSAGEVARVKAGRAVKRVIALFPAMQLEMIQAIILRNVTVRAWTEALPQPASQATEKGRLLTILDLLVQHFGSEVADDLRSGRRLPP
jgi:hypothetical protein